MPTRLLALLATALLAATAGPAACSPADVVGLRPAAEQAQWAVDPAVRLAPDATAVPILVGEVACASGHAADGRIRVLDVSYLEDRIEVVMGVVPREGDQDCQGNPPTPYLLELDEAVGERDLVNAATDEVAARPLLGDAAPQEPGTLFEAEDRLGEREFALVEALHARARDPAELGDLGDLRLHPDGVLLVLGDSGTSREVAPAALGDPDGWVLDPGPDGHAGFAGPFDVLATLASTRHVVITVGDHPHCAGPPKPPPAALDGLVRLGITPGDAESCIDWFAVDLYLTSEGHVRGIVLELFGP